MRHWLFIVSVALLAGATPSWSDIIGIQSNFALGTKTDTELLNLDLDENGLVDFQLYAGGLTATATIHSENENRYLIHPSPPPNIGGEVAALGAGFVIGNSTSNDSSTSWFGSDDGGTLIQILYPSIAGEFYQSRAFIGIEFEMSDGVHYGWLEIEGATPSMENHLLGDNSLIIHGWAYESNPGVGIVAGAIPEPSSGILLILGAIGVWTIRKRKNR